jgi:TetR/AcrR family transcriptional regulator
MQRKRILGKERRELIIEAALEVFSEKGYEGATIKKIAEQAGINQGLIYQHFKNKEDLYKAIIEKASSRFLSPKNIHERMKGNDDREILKFFARLYLEIMRSNEKLIKFINFGQLENPRLFEIKYFQREESPLTILSNYLSKRMKDGKFKKKKSRLAARIFLGIIHWYGLRSLISKAKGWKVYDEDEVLDTIVDIYLHGMIK